jgi:tRNA(Leu) C34 or U34 (ribose-2'-O)-methylase TrmL
MSINDNMVSVALVSPKTHHNVGSAVRACEMFKAKSLMYTGRRYKPAGTDTMKSVNSVPTMRVDDVFDSIPFGSIPIAVDRIEGAVPLHSYKHPKNAFYIFGPEDGTLGKKIHSRCKDVVYIPMDGCLNLAATVNVVLYDRVSKELRND